ncbi:olfactory receptor 4K13-like [Dasypus novemcinctus]|uniref:olfactory receptor 4K13-like n=1 Tax=Dasypus novemcinctus TaxID=9361 RepID=UPI0039C9E7EE
MDLLSNRSSVSDFILLGLYSSQEVQILFFSIFLLVYVAIIVGNLLIVISVIFDNHLHSPMYFLLANLSFFDLCFSSVATPKVIADFLKKRKTISFWGCMAQIFFMHFFGGGEMSLLIAMAIDRYVAICKPLHYKNIMNSRVLIVFLLLSWTIGFVHTTSQMAFTVDLPFCGPNVVNSIFCDLPLVIKLACTETYMLELLVIANSGLLSLVCFILLLISYIVMLVTIWQHSSRASPKAVSTLSAHITVVTLFFGPVIFIYAFPFNSYSANKFLSVFYSVITPFLNPIIYTLRNQEMKAAIKRLSSQRGSEMTLLIVMAVDRYIAICKPLHCTAIMNRRVLTGSVLLSWAVGFVHTMSQMVFTITLPFCGPNVVDNIFCHLPPVLKIQTKGSHFLQKHNVLENGVSPFTYDDEAYASAFMDCLKELRDPFKFLLIS